jgi:hypothetical protein
LAVVVFLGAASLSLFRLDIETTTAWDLRKEEEEQKSLEKGPRHPICERLQDASAIAFWTQHLDQVWHSSRHDVSDDKHQFHAHLLSWITPRLPLSVKSVPRLDGLQSMILPRLMDKAWMRYQFLTKEEESDTSSSSPPPPIHITILGGSVAKGKGCEQHRRDHFSPKCAWPNRLETFLNTAVLGRDSHHHQKLVHVSNLALEGTVTPISTYILKQRLMEHTHPDVIINVHSSNDQNAFNILDKASQQNTSLDDQIFSMLQDFVRTVLSMDDCGEPPPLMIHFNDYVGNLNPTLIDTFATSKAVAMISAYYGVAAASYADVVRDIVYGDTTERLFTSPWYPPHQRRDTANKMSVDVHPPETMHVVSAWIVAFQLLTYASIVCGQEAAYTERAHQRRLMDPSIHQPEQFLSGVLPWNNDTAAIKSYLQDKAAPSPKGLPPILTKETTMDQITQQWRMDAKRQSVCHDAQNCCKTFENQCLFGWLSRTWPVTNRTEDIETLFYNHATTNEWRLVEDNHKLGWAPPDAKQLLPGRTKSMVLDFESIERDISHVDYFYMKSFGPHWNESVVHVDVFHREHGTEFWGSPVASHRLQGTHWIGDAMASWWNILVCF